MNSLDDCEEPEIYTEDFIDPQDYETVCNICNAEFLDPQDLKLHLTQVHASEIPNLVQCHFCTSSSSDLENYAIHIRDYHLQSLKMCAFCTKIFVDFDQHRKHERRHYCAKKNYSCCSQCSEMFISIGELERHEFTHHNNDEDGFMFQDLFPILSSVLNMKAVVFIQAMNSSQPCECVSCGYSSSDVKKYIEHLQQQNCQSFICDNCSNTQKSKKNLVRHLQRHKECFNFVNNTELKCMECHESILCRFYKSHIKSCKPIKCTPCNVVFTSMEQLSNHQCKNHPLTVEVKLCKFCNRQCVGMYALKKHLMRAHKHELHLYKYKCVMCDTPFKHPQKLFAHYFIKHKDLEPYTCKICDKKFRIRKRFTIHIKLDHKSVGFVEFDKNYHVFFTEKKSVKPFVPHCVLSDDELRMYTDIPSKGKKVRSEKSTKLDLDLLNQTETEGNITEMEYKPKKKILKRKLTRNTKTSNEVVVPVESSDEEENVPLVTLKKPKYKKDKKSFQPLWAWRKKSLKDNRKQLTCKVCNKYCYTFQNYQHHMSLHRKNDVKTCIKCSQVFKSMEKLNHHIETEHSSSKLTETLKTLLEKRKKGTVSNTVMSTTEKFQKTIKKSKIDNWNSTTAKITPVDNGLSVQKFLETFTPEADNLKTPNTFIRNSVSIKKVSDPFFRKPTIQMIKFIPAEPLDNPQLTQPIRFTQYEGEPIHCTVKVVQSDTQDYFFTETFDEGVEKGEIIPEVAQEVMLEVTEEPHKQIQVPNQIILPNLPQGSHNISIAHLQSEAPYFKIVKVDQMMTEKPRVDPPRNELIRLPDGTQMITVNPLAHLLGDKNIEEILQPLKNKYYKPKMSRNVENVLTKALEKANTPTNVRKRRAAAKKMIETEYPNQTSEM